MDFPKDERDARILFNLSYGATPRRFQNLIEKFGSLVLAFENGEDGWNNVEGLGSSRGTRLYKSCQKSLPLLEKEKNFIEKNNIDVLISSDHDFPNGFLNIADPPLVIYKKGSLHQRDNFSVGIVGTRQPSLYGRNATERISRQLAEAGVTVISGIARGIDAIAHISVLKEKGRTIGILGSGFGHLYPPENKFLMEKMFHEGAVLSEFPYSTRPDRQNFPQRNRLVAAMSLGIVVVEAKEKSGALITAKLAAEQGKDVFAVPGPIFSSGSYGPHLLLRQGARLIENANDIIEEIQDFQKLVSFGKEKKPLKINMTQTEENLLKNISWEPIGIDELSVKTGVPTAAISSTLVTLELKGAIKALPGKIFVKTEQGIN